jgi:hypothetical protein
MPDPKRESEQRYREWLEKEGQQREWVPADELKAPEEDVERDDE